MNEFACMHDGRWRGGLFLRMARGITGADRFLFFRTALEDRRARRMVAGFDDRRRLLE